MTLGREEPEGDRSGDSARIPLLVNKFTHSFSQQTSRLDARLGCPPVRARHGPCFHGDIGQQQGRHSGCCLMSQTQAFLPCFRMTSKRTERFCPEEGRSPVAKGTDSEPWCCGFKSQLCDSLAGCYLTSVRFAFICNKGMITVPISHSS